MDKKDIVRLVSLAGMALAGVATIVSNWAQDQAMKQEIRRTVEEVLAEQNMEGESE